jgi:hypothetical protein
MISLHTGKRGLLGIYRTGNSVGPRAGVNLMAKRKIPAPTLNESFNFQSVTIHLIDEVINVLATLK